MSDKLTGAELTLLKWLSRDDIGWQYGECHGRTLDGLIAKGLATVGDEDSGLHNGFIAKGTSIMHRAVFISDAGLQALKSAAS